MLSKRIFWLTCIAVACWLIWMRLRQRHDQFATTIPQFAPPQTFAPPRTFAPSTPAAAPTSPAHHPDLDEASAATPAPAPLAANTPPERADTAADAPEDDASA